MSTPLRGTGLGTGGWTRTHQPTQPQDRSPLWLQPRPSSLTSAHSSCNGIISSAEASKLIRKVEKQEAAAVEEAVVADTSNSNLRSFRPARYRVQDLRPRQRSYGYLSTLSWLQGDQGRAKVP